MNGGSADIGDIIGRLSENPEMMKSLMNMAGSIMNGGNGGDRKDEKDSREVAEEGNRQGLPERESGHRRHGRGDDAENLIRLLCALKPYVSGERCEKIDKLVKILKLIQLSEKTGLLTSLL